MKPKPLISIIIPCYNQANFLQDCLDSIIRQTYENWECIIVNDGSLDNTEEIALIYLKKDDRFSYKYKANGGLSSARNFGLSLSRGEWIQFLDCDDFLNEKKLYKAAKQISKNSLLNLVLTNFKGYDDLSNTTLPPYCNINIDLNLETIIKNWDVTFTVPIHCALIKKDLLKGGFDETLKAKEDWLMWIDIFLQEVNYLTINESLAFYRMHCKSMTKNSNLMQENNLNAYTLIFNKINDKLKPLLFEKLINDVKSTYVLKDSQITFLKKSFTYRVGDFILKPFKFVKNRIKALNIKN